MNDEGNTVVFSKKWGSYIENDITGERISLERRGGTFVMVLKGIGGDKVGGDKVGGEVKKAVRRIEAGEKMDIGAAEDMVFRRRVLD